MVTAIVILSGLALLQLWLNVSLYVALRYTWKELRDKIEEVLPYDWEEK